MSELLRMQQRFLNQLHALIGNEIAATTHSCRAHNFLKNHGTMEDVAFLFSCCNLEIRMDNSKEASPDLFFFFGLTDAQTSPERIY
jgi:hypothetical protein